MLSNAFLKRLVLVKGVSSDVDQRNRRDPTHQRVGRSQDLVPCFGATLFKILRLRPQHQMRKVDIEFVRWNVGALGEVAQIAHVALIDYLVVIGDVYTIDF